MRRLWSWLWPHGTVPQVRQAGHDWRVPEWSIGWHTCWDSVPVPPILRRHGARVRYVALDNVKAPEITLVLAEPVGEAAAAELSAYLATAACGLKRHGSGFDCLGCRFVICASDAAVPDMLPGSRENEPPPPAWGQRWVKGADGRMRLEPNGTSSSTAGSGSA